MGYDPGQYARDKPTRELKWVGMDLDGTLAHQVWPIRGIGPPVTQAVAECIRIRAARMKIVIHTSRPWTDYENIERWLNDHGIPWDHIQCGKPLYAAYFDDKAVRPDWAPGATDA